MAVNVDNIEAEDLTEALTFFDEEKDTFEFPEDHAFNDKYASNGEEKSNEENKTQEQANVEETQTAAGSTEEESSENETQEEDELSKTQQKLEETRNNLLEANQKLKSQERERIKNSFKVLSDDDEQDLKDTDPETHSKYITDKTSHESQMQQIQDGDLREHAELQSNNLIAFLAGTQGKEITEDSKFDYLGKLLNQNSDEYKLAKQVSDLLETKYQPDENGIYSTDDFVNAHKSLNLPNVIQEAEQNARDEAVNNINAAVDNPTQSKLGGVSNVDQQGDKNLDDWSQAEIDKMGADDIRKILEKDGSPGY